MKSDKSKWIQFGIAGIIVLAAVLWYFTGERGDLQAVDLSRPVSAGAALGESEAHSEAELVDPDNHTAAEPQTSDGLDSDNSNDENVQAATGTQTWIYVHVCGEVALPGVYELSEGSRLYQAVEAAGGMTEHAADDFVNMAQILSDGMQLRIPDRSEAEKLRNSGIDTAVFGNQPGIQSGEHTQPGLAGTGDSRVNINTATKEQLMTLSGIGESRAEAIIAYRDKSGGFKTIEDIMKVSGIKEAAFQKIKEDITV